MKHWIVMCLVVGLSACEVSTSEPSEPDEPRGESQGQPIDEPRTADEASAEDVALRTAAATGDPQIMADTALAFAAACHGAVSCPGYGSCGTWATATDCGSTFCGNICGPRCNPLDPCDRPQLLTQRTERYRVCFNAAGQSCTEWTAGTSRVLGCGAGGCLPEWPE